MHKQGDAHEVVITHTTNGRKRSVYQISQAHCISKLASALHNQTRKRSAMPRVHVNVCFYLLHLLEHV